MALAYALDATRPTQIGLVVLQADESLEQDMRRLLPNDVECLVARVPSATTVSSENLRAMKGRLTEAASLLPRGARFAAVGYGCTSAAAEIGAEHIATLIKAGVDTPHVTEPVSALIAACRDRNLTRIGLISPYVASVSDRLRAVLGEAGIAVTAFDSFEEPSEERVARISASSLQQAAIEMGRMTDCDGVFLSCTNLRTLDVLGTAQATINKPVLSSNQVLAWHLSRLANFEIARGEG